MNITWNSTHNINIITNIFRQELKSYVHDLTQLHESKSNRMSNLDLVNYSLYLLNTTQKDYPQTYQELVKTTILGHDNTHIEKIIHTQRINLLNKLSSILVEFSDDDITLSVRTSIVLLTNRLRELNCIN